MHVVVADDSPVSRTVLTRGLSHADWQVRTVEDGVEAWNALRTIAAPAIGILDWMMPGLTGPEVCRKLRQAPPSAPLHLIILTARQQEDATVEALEAGADDFLRKPFSLGELRARLQVAGRTLGLQQVLTQRVRQLESALAEIKELRGILPICLYCKKIRDDKNYWNQLEHYLSKHTDAQFSHGICPDCYEEVFRNDPRLRGPGTAESPE